MLVLLGILMFVGTFLMSVASSISLIATFVPQLTWFAMNAWWLYSISIFLIAYGLSRNLIVSIVVTVLIFLLLKMAGI